MGFEITTSWVTGIIGGVVLGTATQFVIGTKEWMQTKAEKSTRANYAAFRLANMFEDYAVECARRIQNVNAYFDSSGIHGAPYGELPLFHDYPSDIDWKVFDSKLSDAALAFPRHVLLSNDQVDFVIRDGNPLEPEDGAAECCIHCGVRGFQAWKLACKIREQYKLELRTKLADNWDVVDYLKKEHDKYEERLKHFAHI